MRSPLTPFLAAEVPTHGVAGSALRMAYAAVFLAQVALAAVVGAVLFAALPTPPRPNDWVAGVLVAFAALHLPLGAGLAWAASRSAGKGAALAGAITAAVLLSVPAWFLALAMLSAQRTPFLLAGGALLAVGYGVGFAFVPRFVQAATTPVERPEGTEPAPDDELVDGAA
ncbi:MAG: hypothetical protein ABR510_05655 [Trueperaceae bacterium]